MKLQNTHGNEIYFNVATKNGRERFIIKAITPGLTIPDRDRTPHKSRTFTQLAQAEHWLQAHGYENRCTAIAEMKGERK